MDSVDIRDAKKNFSRLIDRVQSGEEIVISAAGKPVAKLSPVDMASRERPLGLLKGKLYISDDFDDPLPADLPPGR